MHRMGRSTPSNSLEVAEASPAGMDKSTNKAHQAGLQSIKIILLVGMVVQNSATVLVGRYTRSSVAKENLYDVNHLVCICEIVKLVLSMALEGYSLGGIEALLESIQLHVVSKPLDALKILVPALLYLVQNTLIYVALSNLTAPIFQVTYQGKLVTTALVSVVMLQRSYSVQQWICLCILSLGVGVAVLGEKSGDPSSANSAHMNIVVGLTAVTISCLSSALAGVYFEKVLKKPGNEKQPASLWMRNMQLAFFSVVVALGQGAYKRSSVPADTTSVGYLHGFSFWVWVLVALQAGGGILVAAVIKVSRGSRQFVDWIMHAAKLAAFFHPLILVCGQCVKGHGYRRINRGCHCLFDRLVQDTAEQPIFGGRHVNFAQCVLLQQSTASSSNACSSDGNNQFASKVALLIIESHPSFISTQSCNRQTSS
jgi:UDP-sugar transporter A1/2/3